MEKPNILFILTDQQRMDTLKCYDGEYCYTPNLDELAAGSTVFTNTYASSPICTPARASIQTGLYPMHHGMLTNTYSFGSMVQELPDSPLLLSRRLQEAGYSVGYTGKWHLGNGKEELVNEPGFEENMSSIEFSEIKHNVRSVPTTVGYEGDDFPGHGYGGHNYPSYKDYLNENNLEHTLKNRIYGNYDVHEAATITSPIESTIDYYLTERAIHHIEEFKDREHPWFFQLNFWGPHEPYYAHESYLDLYKDMELEPWHNFYEEDGNKPKIHDVKRANSQEWSTFESYIKHYYAFMTQIDAEIGRLIQYLKDKDLYDNTVIIFSSDHGESLGIHGGLSDKAIFMYEEICNIPLMIKGTNAEEIGWKEERFAGTCDIYSTILELAGYSRAESERDGKSLVPLLLEEQTVWRDSIVTECSGIASLLFTQRMIRKGDWKYVFNSGDIDELYNLYNDPYEQYNLVDDSTSQSQLCVMQQSLEKWMMEHKDGLLKQYRLLTKGA